jgi:hypothetical protein
MSAELDDVITPISIPIMNPQNRETAATIANLVVEAATHRSILHEIYITVCNMAGVAPKRKLLTQLADEEERHVERAEINVASLRSAAAG